MPTLPEKPSLSDFQKYVGELEQERGFSSQGVLEKCLLLGEEIGELFKAVRKTERISIEAGSQYGRIGEELADVFIYLCAIANRMDIHLENAFRDKEMLNHKRHWK
ncbi:MAG: pyrophosphohydrolase [Deltaproteobacteria bacterium]|nr:pyrophosphohydrolase [Deltaproteobacteria bacterium]